MAESPRAVDTLQSSPHHSRPADQDTNNGILRKGLANTPGRIESRLTLKSLQTLRKRFEEADRDGKGSIDFREFKSFIVPLLDVRSPGKEDEDHVEDLFRRIDTNSDGYVDWSELFTHVQHELDERNDGGRVAHPQQFGQSKLGCVLPPNCADTPHHDQINRVRAPRHNVIVSLSNEGTLCYWNTADGKLQLSKTRRPPGETRTRTGASVAAKTAVVKKPKWVTDFALLPDHNKLVFSLASKELEFYDSNSFAAHSRIMGLEAVPLRMDVFCKGAQSLLVFGDADGCVNVFTFLQLRSAMGEWQKHPIVNGVPSITAYDVLGSDEVKFARWKMHRRMVNDVCYIDKLQSVISCSNDTTSPIVIGKVEGSTRADSVKESNKNPKKPMKAYVMAREHFDCDKQVFSAHKGVRTFSYSTQSQLLATGGLDHVVRLWNPYMASKPTGYLRGHTSIITYLCIMEEDGRLISVCNDKMVKIWDLRTHNCLLLLQHNSHRIRSELQAVCFNHDDCILAMATDQVALLRLTGKTHRPHEAISHKEAVTAVCCDPKSRQVATTSVDSTVCLWDFNTGTPIFEFIEAHGKEAIVGVKFGHTNKQLITAGEDGRVKIWNFSDGQCLCELVPSKALTEHKGKELHRKVALPDLCAMEYVNLPRDPKDDRSQSSRYVVAVGWEQRVNRYLVTNTENQCVPSLPLWSDDTPAKGHHDDIYSVAFGAPDCLATGDYSGHIIMWNFLTGRLITKINVHEACIELHQHSEAIAEIPILSLLFLPDRHGDRGHGITLLVSCGCAGYVDYWYANGHHAGCMRVPEQHKAVERLAATKNGHTLITACSSGYLGVWNVSRSHSSSLTHAWRAHAQSINCVEIVEKGPTDCFVLTASADCCVRLWTVTGMFIGTFGQSEAWEVGCASTYRHLTLPSDIMSPLPEASKKSADSEGQVTSIESQVSLQTSNSSLQVSTAEAVQSTSASVKTLPRMSPVEIALSEDTYEGDNLPDNGSDSSTTKRLSKRLRQLRLDQQNSDSPSTGPYHNMLVFDLVEPKEPDWPSYARKQPPLLARRKNKKAAENYCNGNTLAVAQILPPNNGGQAGRLQNEIIEHKSKQSTPPVRGQQQHQLQVRGPAQFSQTGVGKDKIKHLPVIRVNSQDSVAS